MRKLRILTLFLLFLASLFFFNACQKEAGTDPNQVPDGQQRVRIRLTDGPVNFDAVNVDIQQVEVLVVPDSCRTGRGTDDDDDEEEEDGDGCHHDHPGDRDHHNYRCFVWDTLDIRPGVYNLLDLSNGTDTLLASGFTIAGTIKQIRLTLGTNNSVVIDSISYPLQVWNSMRRVTINVRGEDIEEITPGDLQLWLDFDAGRSIVKLSHNRFILKSFLRIWVPSQTAAIKGKVLPAAASPVVSAIANGDTLIAIPENGGRFKIRGLRGTSAVVLINATAGGYVDTTLIAVPLQRGRETDIGTIQLHN